MPSGFALPVAISPELARFIEVAEGTLVSRPYVTQVITKYIKDHNLQVENNRRIIDLNKPGGQPLRDLLKIPEGTEITFFSFQRYLKDHYPNRAQPN